MAQPFLQKLYLRSPHIFLSGPSNFQSRYLSGSPCRNLYRHSILFQQTTKVEKPSLTKSKPTTSDQVNKLKEEPPHPSEVLSKLSPSATQPGISSLSISSLSDSKEDPHSEPQDVPQLVSLRSSFDDPLVGLGTPFGQPNSSMNTTQFIRVILMVTSVRLIFSVNSLRSTPHRTIGTTAKRTFSLDSKTH